MKMYLDWLRQITTGRVTHVAFIHDWRCGAWLLDFLIDQNHRVSYWGIVYKQTAGSLQCRYIYRHCALLSLTIRQLVLVACSFEIPQKKRPRSHFVSSLWFPYSSIVPSPSDDTCFMPHTWFFESIGQDQSTRRYKRIILFLNVKWLS